MRILIRLIGRLHPSAVQNRAASTCYQPANAHGCHRAGNAIHPDKMDPATIARQTHLRRQQNVVRDPLSGVERG